MKLAGVLLTFLLFVSFGVAAQFNPMQPQKKETEGSEFTGKWQEYERAIGKKEKRAQATEITDGMQLEFMPDSTVRVWFSKGKYYNERYSVDRSELRFGDIFLFDKYYFDQKDLVLHQASTNTWHYFKGVDKLEQGAIKKVVPGVEEGVVNTSPSNVKGIWSVYKKEDKAFSGKKLYLKTLEIVEDNGMGAYSVEAKFTNMRTAEMKKGTATISKTTLVLNLEDNETLTYNILKLDNNEMLLTSEGVVLYLKEFGR